LIVRALPSRRPQILVQASVNTWQAYNNWGGKSLYAFNSTNHVPANHVSFSRPSGPPLVWEIGLLRFLEREGYDVSYTTDVDTDRNPGELRRHRLVISSGHDEYWSKGMRDAFEAARNRGTNPAFLGADIADWQIRYEANRRTIVEYRDATIDPITDPARKTVRFRNLVPPRSECELRGVTSVGAVGANDPPRSYLVNPAALRDAWFRGTGFTATSTLPDSVGYEWDATQPGCAVLRSPCCSAIRVLVVTESRQGPRLCATLPPGPASSVRVRSSSSGDLTTTTRAPGGSIRACSGSCGTRLPI
jgi:hypothetical protein